MTLPTITPAHFKRVAEEQATITNHAKQILIRLKTEDAVAAQAAIFIAQRLKEDWVKKPRTLDDVYSACMESMMTFYRLFKVAELEGNNAEKSLLLQDFDAEISGEPLSKSLEEANALMKKLTQQGGKNNKK